MSASKGVLDLLTNPRPQQARDLYVRALANAYRYGVLPDPSFALGQDINIYELVRRDAVIKHVMDLRRHAVAGSDATTLPGDETEAGKQASKVGQALLDRIANLHSAKLDLADAVFNGSAFAKIEGHREILRLCDGKARSWFVIDRLHHIDRRRVSMRRPQGSDPNASHVLHVASIREGGAWKPVEHPEWLVQHVYDDQESSLGHGRGLMDALFVSWFAKTQAFEQGMEAMERWAQGMSVLLLDPDRVGSGDQRNDLLVQQAIDTFERHKSRHVLVGMKGDELSLLEGPGQGHQIATWWVTYLDNSITRLVLGALLPSGGGDGETGSYARAEVEQESSSTLLRFDRVLLEQTLTRYVMRMLWNLNRANLADCGLALAPMPHVSLASEDRTKPSDFAEMLTKLLTAGVPVGKKYAYERLGIPVPQADEEVLEGRPPPDPFGAPPGEGPPGASGGPPGGERPGEAREGGEGEKPQQKPEDAPREAA